jgi:hypothetical protein
MTVATTPNELLYSNTGYSAATATGVAQYADPSYYAQQITKFQEAMNQLDATAQQMQALQALPDLDPSIAADVAAWLDDFNAHKQVVQATAAAVNLAANTANALGVPMPVLSLPQSLGLVPVAAIAAIALAVAGIAAILSWRDVSLAQAANIAQRQVMIGNLPADQQAAALAALDALQKNQTGGALGQIASIVQWVAIGVAVYFGYKAFRDLRG